MNFLLQNHNLRNELKAHISSKMAEKRFFNKEEIQERGFRSFSLLLLRFLNRFSVVFIVLFLLFLWSSSNIIFSGSLVNVCVLSRKFGNPYCLSVGAKTSSYDTPLSLINETINSSYNNTIKPLVFPSNSSSIKDEVIDGVKSATPKSISHSENDISTLDSVKSRVEDSEFTKIVLMKGVDKAIAEEKAYSRKAVEEEIAFLRSFVSKVKPSSCEGRGIYVYDLPSKFNMDLVGKCDEMMTWIDFCKYFTNDAMGEPIPDLGKGWYNTHQFSLEPIFHKRILRHPCRVENQEKAKIFYVPFYGALDMIKCHFGEGQCDAKNANLLSNELVEWLGQQKMWKRNNGSDHVFVLGKITYDFRREENGAWGSNLLELGELENSIKLLIERHPWTITEVGVPYPTYFHPNSDKEIIAWQEKIRRTKRRNLISFAGGTYNRWNNIRPILIDQCTSAPKVCNYLNCSGDACVESSPAISLFMESEFCLQPGGDSPTRKSMFDSLIVGCIPVVFDPHAAHYQYPWHLPEDYKKYSIFIDQDAVQMSEVNVIKELVKIPSTRRKEMRKYIINELMPRLVYANVDAKLEKFEDAITISVNNLFQMAVSKLF